jgi:[acyl-carrier-protein] S-malonyltransferase
MKLVFVFPGQGSQYPGMGKVLAAEFSEAKAVFEAADDALGFSISKLCFEGTDAELKQTKVTQPAILATSLAAHAVFTRRFETAPAYLLGHSLGEYSALVAAQSLSLAEGLSAVHARGAFMQEAVPEGVGAMAAVLGLDSARVDAVCAEASKGPEDFVSSANYNEPMQTVIAGHAGAVARASEGLKAAGAKRVLPLPVSAPFHCQLMHPVTERLRPLLERIAFKTPSAPVVSNVEATPNADATKMVSLLLRQIVSPVRFTESVRALTALGVTHAVELGPGRVLSGLLKRIDTTVQSTNVEDSASLTKALAALGPQ